jgi:Tol biopolymer transport system component
LKFGEVTRLTSLHGNCLGAEFSPDGQHLLCTSQRNTSEEQCTVPEIFRMTWDGQEQTRLTYTEFEQTGEMAWEPRNLHPRYSPDGRYIAFASSVHGARGENRFEIYRMQPDGSEQTRLTYTQGSASYPLWHPDSKYIAFTCWLTDAYTRKNSVDIYLVDREGSELRRLEESSSINWLNSFSPDGRFLAFDSNRYAVTESISNNWEIFLRDMTTGEVHRMTDNAVSDREPLFSPDGTALLFQSQDEGKATLYYAEIQY